MIRAADDYDAIHARIQELRGAGEIEDNEPVDIEWVHHGGTCYSYYLISQRAKDACVDATFEEDGGIKLDLLPQHAKFGVLKDFVFRQRV